MHLFLKIVNFVSQNNEASVRGRGPITATPKYFKTLYFDGILRHIYDVSHCTTHSQ